VGARELLRALPELTMRLLLLTLLLASCAPPSDKAEVPPAPPAPSLLLPGYEVIDRVGVMRGGTYGDVLIPSFRPEMPRDSLETAARGIMAAEGFTEAGFYSHADAQRANFSESFSRAHPDAMRTGYLGTLRQGVFTPSSYIEP